MRSIHKDLSYAIVGKKGEILEGSQGFRADIQQGLGKEMGAIKSKEHQMIEMNLCDLSLDFKELNQICNLFMELQKQKISALEFENLIFGENEEKELLQNDIIFLDSRISNPNNNQASNIKIANFLNNESAASCSQYKTKIK